MVILKRLSSLARLSLGAMLVAAWGPAVSKAAYAAPVAGKKLIYLSMSYDSNVWQPESEHIIQAVAASPPYKNYVDFHITVAGTDVEKQISQIDSAVAAGAKGILIYPISPTALNATIERACAAGVKIMTYDSVVTAPCAYGVQIHQHYAGMITAKWLAEKLHGHGNIVLITGVAGTSVDLYRTSAAKAEFAKFPGIHIVASDPGNWAEAPAKEDMANILASTPASNIQGIWSQVGCYAVTQLYLERHLPLVPCSGEQVEGHLLYMLPKSQGGAGLQSVSYSATNITGAIAFEKLVDLVMGVKNIPHKIYVKFRLISNSKEPGVPTIPLKVCKTGTFKDLASGCDVFAPSLDVPSGFFTDIYSPDIGYGLQQALTGKPDNSPANPGPPASVATWAK